MTRERALLLMVVVAAVFAGPVRAEDGAKEAKPGKDGVVAGYRGVALTLPGGQLAFVSKGDRVDVLVTFEAQMKDAKKEKVTATILQNIVVLGVRPPAKPEENGVIELEVNPNEGQYAALAYHAGEINLMLRAPGDTEMKPMEMASFRKLFR